MRVAAFTKYGREAASTRQRVLQYHPHLARCGIQVDVYPLLSDAYVQSLVSGESFSKLRIAAAYARRLRHLSTIQRYDLIWIYAELFPWLPGPLERLALRLNQPLIYDFDDAFFHSYDDHSNPLLRSILHGKLHSLINGAAAICAGNQYLRDYAARLNEAVYILPTVVDTDLYRPAPHSDRPLTIGWIGSPSTWAFVKPLLPILAEISAVHAVNFHVVGGGTAAETDRFEGMTVHTWSEAREISLVQAMDIGIMPLPDELWTRGKSGYKLIQYMACGLPVVASPVGANTTIVEAGVTGFLATGVDEWRSALYRLIHDPSLRLRMGEAGRAQVVRSYSLETQAPRLVSIMEWAVKHA